ncbi:MAG: molybdenum cofactor guanylyltransferase [Promethearchaeota archaeon]|nr:MAG: molybdenum cofactor guanylyltransferase [Candidatus Lokiarchaeota archaeon]
MNNNKQLAFVVLMGGKSTRFGVEKPVINLLGKPLILYQIEILSKIDRDMFLIAHSEEQIYNYKKQINFPTDIHFVIDDKEIFPFPKLFKPMLGIYSGFRELDNMNFQKGFLLSCDMPLIKPEVIQFLIKESEGFDCCIPRWNNGFLEPFFAIYPVKKTYQRAKWILETTNYGLLNLMDKSWNINYISVEDTIKPLDKNLTSFININGPIDIMKVINLYNN